MSMTQDILDQYYNKFQKYAFVDKECELPEQFEASITRLYHTIEKGLSYEDYRAGFGKGNVNSLIVSMEQYHSRGYDIDKSFYKTALNCLYLYVSENKKHGYVDEELAQRIDKLPGEPNNLGGTIVLSPTNNVDKLDYKELMTQRHSIRHFDDSPVDIELIKESIRLAQHTPSACNRQGWRTIIIADKEKIKAVLDNQNGNRGFGNEIDKLLVITADLRTEQKNREIFQAFIDGGMYAENIINSLYYHGIGSIPLSASLTSEQEDNVRKITGIDDAEVLILFVGVGNYPDSPFKTTRSERREASIEVI